MVTNFGGSHTDFGASINVDAAVGLTRQGRPDSVHNTDAEGTPLHAVSEGKDSIGSLATLAEEDNDIISEDRSLAVQKVARELDTNGNFSELFENGASRKA